MACLFILKNEWILNQLIMFVFCSITVWLVLCSIFPQVLFFFWCARTCLWQAGWMAPGLPQLPAFPHPAPSGDDRSSRVPCACPCTPLPRVLKGNDLKSLHPCSLKTLHKEFWLLLISSERLIKQLRRNSSSSPKIPAVFENYWAGDRYFLFILTKGRVPSG